jgi:hypothetical protein
VQPMAAGSASLYFMKKTCCKCINIFFCYKDDLITFKPMMHKYNNLELCKINHDKLDGRLACDFLVENPYFKPVHFIKKSYAK